MNSPPYTAFFGSFSDVMSLWIMGHRDGGIARGEKRLGMGIELGGLGIRGVDTERYIIESVFWMKRVYLALGSGSGKHAMRHSVWQIIVAQLRSVMPAASHHHLLKMHSCGFFLSE